MPRSKVSPVEIIEEILRYHEEKDDVPGSRQYKPEEEKLFTCSYAMRIFGKYWNNVISCAGLKPKSGSSMISKELTCLVCKKDFSREIVEGSDLSSEPLNVCSLGCMKTRWPKKRKDKSPPNKKPTMSKPSEKQKEFKKHEKTKVVEDPILLMDKKYYNYSTEEEDEVIKEGCRCPGPLCKNKERNKRRFFISIDKEKEIISSICRKCCYYEEFIRQYSKHKLLNDKLIECKTCYLCDRKISSENKDSFFLKLKSKSADFVQTECLSRDIDTKEFLEIIGKGELFCLSCAVKKE